MSKKILGKLVKKVFDYTIESFDYADKVLKVSETESVKVQGMVMAVLELSFFYIHLISRMIFSKFGLEKRNEVIANMIQKLESEYFRTIFKDHNDKDKEIISNLYYITYEEAEDQYGDFDSRDSLLVLLVQRLTERLYRAFYNEGYTKDILFDTAVKGLVLQVFNFHEIEMIVEKLSA